MRIGLAFFVLGAAQGQLRHPWETHSRESGSQFCHSYSVSGVDISARVVRWARVALSDHSGPPQREQQVLWCLVAQLVCTAAPSQPSHQWSFFCSPSQWQHRGLWRLLVRSKKKPTKGGSPARGCANRPFGGSKVCQRAVFSLPRDSIICFSYKECKYY